jgi:23S rRNA (uracil1939-C5)-methyltransferase
VREVQEGAVYSGVVSGYSSDGAGVVRTGGEVVFVPGTIRGERVDFRITKVMRSSAAGEIVAIHDPSPERIEPDCSYFGKCGGCVYRHMTYEEELRAKYMRVQDALSRIGGLTIGIETILGAEHPLHYRNKCQYPVGSDGAVGFYRQRTHQVVPVVSCRIQSEQADATMRAVRDWMRRYRIPGYDERTGKGLIRHIYVRVNHQRESLCCVIANSKRLPREPELTAMVCAAVPGTVGVVLCTNRERGNVILGNRYRTIWGRDSLMDSLCDLSFKLSIPSFYQVNREQAEVLYKKAVEFAGLTGQETVLDLYCGTGTITLCMAKRARRVIGAEIIPEAIRDAKENARRNQITNAEFFCGDAGNLVERLQKAGLRPDVIAVDPPRKGLAPEVVRSVAGMTPKRVVYVSCDPATLARDTRLFKELGYEATRAIAVDLFPGTRHVETVVQLSRKKPDDVIEIDLNLDELDATSAETKATYEEIKEYVLKETGLKVSSLYISQVKRKCGLEVGESYNLPKGEKVSVPQCPKDQEDAIRAALKHFAMI